MILRGLAVGPLASNCYITGSESGREGMIIDPGDDATGIVSTVDDLKLDIKLIVLTHGHLDHVGALKELKEAIGAEIAMHDADVEFLQGQAQTLGAMFGLSYPVPPQPDKLLTDGDNLDIGDLHFSILHTPGHSPGGICIYGCGVVFTGDTLFNQGIGRTDLPGGNYEQLMDSIHTKLMKLPAEVMVYPGHGTETTIGQEIQLNPFLHG